MNPADALKVPSARIFSALHCFIVSASNDLSVADGLFDQGSAEFSGPRSGVLDHGHYLACVERAGFVLDFRRVLALHLFGLTEQRLVGLLN